MKKLSIFIRVLLIPFLGIIAGGITYSVLKCDALIPRLEFVLNAIISTSATISGFIMASVAILVGAANKPIMVKVRQKGALGELKTRFILSLILGFIVIIWFTIMGLRIGEDNSVSVMNMSLCIGIIVSYAYSILSTVYYLLSIIGLLDETPVTVDNKASIPVGEFRGKGEKR